MAKQWKKRYLKKQQRLKVPSNRAALEEARFFRELNSELTERMGHLIDALSKWDIDVSWDGLRRFWSIELTESGCLKRDRACKAEAENAKLRELLVDAYGYINHPADASWTHMRRKEARDSINGRMRELGIEG